MLLKFLGYLWCKPPHGRGENVSALLQVQCLHIANACLGSLSGKTVKELTKVASTGVWLGNWEKDLEKRGLAQLYSCVISWGC